MSLSDQIETIERGASPLTQRVVDAFKLTERCACSHPAGDHSWVVDHRPDGSVERLRLAHCRDRDCKCDSFTARGA